jgi:hypothetical protein
MFAMHSDAWQVSSHDSFLWQLVKVDGSSLHVRYGRIGRTLWSRCASRRLENIIVHLFLPTLLIGILPALLKGVLPALLKGILPALLKGILPAFLIGILSALIKPTLCAVLFIGIFHPFPIFESLNSLLTIFPATFETTAVLVIATLDTLLVVTAATLNAFLASVPVSVCERAGG